MNRRIYCQHIRKVADSNPRHLISMIDGNRKSKGAKLTFHWSVNQHKWVARVVLGDCWKVLPYPKASSLKLGPNSWRRHSPPPQNKQHRVAPEKSAARRSVGWVSTTLTGRSASGRSTAKAQSSAHPTRRWQMRTVAAVTESSPEPLIALCELVNYVVGIISRAPQSTSKPIFRWIRRSTWCRR